MQHTKRKCNENKMIMMQGTIIWQWHSSWSWQQHRGIKDAKNNAKINNINNATFICDDASNVLTEYANEHRHFDCVFIDPPRKGVDERFINALKTVKPKKVVYISCEPETLARDLSLLQDEYEIKYVQPVDMFPFTFYNYLF